MLKARERQTVALQGAGRDFLSTGAGLVEACGHPGLFGIELWPRQRQLLEEIERGPRMHVLALGRRSSKTTMMALVGLWCCLLRPGFGGQRRLGERGYAIGVATKLDQARVMIRIARGIVEASPILRHQLVNATETELRFANDTAFAAFPCTGRGGRGWPIFALLMDEVAHFLDTDGNSAAERVWQAFAPATAQFGDDARVIVGSTPWGTTGLFADLYERASDGEIDSAKAHHATSMEINPTLSAEFLEEERSILGEDAFASEYLADFVSAGGVFLSRADIDDAIAERPALPPEAAQRWVAGLDPAFSRDPFGLALVGQDAARKTLVLGVARRWLPEGRAGSFEESREVQDSLLDEVIRVCRQYRAKVITDQFMAPAVSDRLRRAGLQVVVETMTAASKTDAFVELRARLAASEIELYREPQLVDELRRLRSRFSAGRSAVLNPRVGDSHGDMAQALALAVWGQRTWHAGARPMRVSRPRTEVDVQRAWSVHRGDVSSGVI